jgi:LuxR family transcriptional regulator, positive regulator of biofilm formation
MKSKSSKEDRPAHGSLRGKSIWIIGPRRLQNELLAELLAGKSGAGCFYAPSMSQAPARETSKEERSNLVLLDCLGQDLEGCLASPRTEYQGFDSPHLVALFNVQPGLGIEERGLREGIRGFFYENDPPELLQKGVRALFGGQLWVSREIMSRCLLEDKGRVKAQPRDTQGLSPRELEILSRITMGATNEEIGARLCISTNTVKTHVYNIFRKIKVPNRLQAALWAAKHL